MKKPDSESTTLRVGSIPPPGMVDPVLDAMNRYQIPLTRANYLDFAYPDGLPEEWRAELEALLPEPIQDWESLETDSPEAES